MNFPALPPAGAFDLPFLVLDWSLFIAQLFLGLAMACAAYRLIFGPRAQDRVLGLDTFYVNAMLLLLTYGIRIASTIYFEVALIIGLLGFVGTAALSKFLMRGEVIE
ncbi:K+/H+ antiporter subunit F [Pseudochelatococcus sp. B33]